MDVKILTLSLENIGPYKGVNRIELNTEGNRNIVLIGGKNGSGKTTILKSIKLGLFGASSYTSEQNLTQYYREVKKILNYRLLSDVQTKYSIEISFNLEENFLQNVYTIKRSWSIINDEISEKVDAFKDSNELDGKETLDLFAKLNDIYPPSMIDFSLFDGDKIAHLIDDGNIENYIKELFHANFGINYLKRLDNDLLSYLRNESRKKELSNEELTLINLETDIKNYNNIISSKEATLKRVYSQNKSEKLAYQLKTKDFNKLGGISDETKTKILNQLRDKELLNKKINQRLNDFFENDYFLFLNRDLIKNVHVKFLENRPNLFLRQAIEMESFLTDKTGIKIVIDELKNKVKSINVDYDFTKSEEIILNRVIQTFSTTSKRKLLKDFDEVQKSYIETKEFREIIAQNENSSLNEILSELYILNEKIKTSSDLVINLENEIIDLKNLVNGLVDQAHVLERNIRNDSNERNSFVVVRNIIKTINEFESKYSSDIRSQVALEALRIFNKITIQKGLLSKIQLDEFFNIALFESNEKEIPISILSMGERQLLIASLIFSIVKVSKRNTIFIFDTPLARLDKENRVNFVQYLVRDISKQVIILSTNSEIVNENLEAIDTSIFSKYLLQYNSKTKCTNILKEYFE